MRYLCSKCRAFKREIDFNVESAQPHGISAWCKLCKKAYSKRWRANNGNYRRQFGNPPDAAKRAEYRAKRLKRHVSWADKKKIKAFYIRAAYLTEKTGIQHEVDHIIPLQGKLISGLHVENNMQILTKSENSAKRNSFEI